MAYELSRGGGGTDPLMIFTLDTYAPNFIKSQGFSSLLQAFKCPENDDNQELLEQANAALLDIETESSVIYGKMKEQYSIRFPELATFELTSSQYARVVLLLSGEDLNGNNSDFDEMADLSTLNTQKLGSASTGLPNATVMIISVTAATTKGRPFTLEEWKITREIAFTLIEMDLKRREILKFIESRMESVAPNVTALVGVEVASQLIGAAGGIVQLSRIPAGNIQVIGRGGRKHLSGLSTATVGIHSGFIEAAPLISEISPEYRTRAQRLLSAKVSMASRVDASGDFKDASFGRRLYDEIVGKLEKLSEPAPLKSVKPLPIPDSERKKRRGGKRARKLKELYEQSEARKQKNRLAFGETAETEIIVGDRIEGLGMLGIGNLRALTSASSTNSDLRLREHLKKQAQVKLNTTGNSGMKTFQRETESITLSDSSNAGPASEITNPAASSSKYFNLNSGFKRNKD